MNNSLNSCNTNYSFSHQIPAPWKNGDIKPSQLLPQANLLAETLLANELSSEEITALRKDKKFHNFYTAIHHELEEGTGVIFLPNTNITNKLNKKVRSDLFLNFCQFFGEPVPINKEKDVIREVRDRGVKDSVTQPVRGHLTNQALPFHSDRADLTALLCESTAITGGEFKICSSANLFYELQNQPDILQILAANIPHDLRDEGSEGSNICSHPILAYKDIFWMRYIRKFITSTIRHGLSINDKLISALDTIDTIINRENFYQEISFNPGDMIIFNNHLTLHARNAFTDSDSQQRCSLRVWLSTEFTRELPASLTPIFHSVEAGSLRGGII